ncbi:MAG: hypothetical protein J6X14_04475 [Lachnospiraceae bacterium]|nr:hypothetical protein [Lachnospiraceae bacterium]MBP5263379.1 hypothetical protein [Lachnospiraceae bacterium]MBP5669545.1 hypothetical protein [Lachnospiraceae bacterium]MBP5732753.1 hypothetical protein [Lachnospiraceae bacterium]
MLKKYSWYYLLQIPVWIFLYAIVVELGLIVDALLFGGAAEGEKRIPYLGLAIFVLATIGLIVKCILSIVKFVRTWMQNAKKRRSARESMIAKQQVQSNVATHESTTAKANESE